MRDQGLTVVRVDRPISLLRELKESSVTGLWPNRIEPHSYSRILSRRSSAGQRVGARDVYTGSVGLRVTRRESSI